MRVAGRAATVSSSARCSRVYGRVYDSGFGSVHRLDLCFSLIQSTVASPTILYCPPLLSSPHIGEGVVLVKYGK